MQALAATFRVLSDSQTFLEEVRRDSGAPIRVSNLYMCSFAMMSVFGAVMGAFDGWQQALSSAIKLPVLFLFTIAICFPTLYILMAQVGAKVRAAQLFTVLVSAVSVASLLLLAFVPVTTFFLVTTTDYQFYKLLNVGLIGVASAFGTGFLARGVRQLAGDSPTWASARKVLISWIVLFGFVGTQLGWTLRPFFGAPDRPFEIVRSVEGNFYSDLLRSVRDVLLFE